MKGLHDNAVSMRRKTRAHDAGDASAKALQMEGIAFADEDSELMSKLSAYLRKVSAWATETDEDSEMRRPADPEGRLPDLVDDARYDDFMAHYKRAVVLQDIGLMLAPILGYKDLNGYFETGDPKFGSVAELLDSLDYLLEEADAAYGEEETHDGTWTEGGEGGKALMKAAEGKKAEAEDSAPADRFFGRYGG
jgi:hypothetical protein